MTDRLICRDEITKITGLSLMALTRLEKQGIFPKRRQLTPKKVAWLESEVMAWIRQLAIKYLSGNGGAKEEQ